MPAPAAGVAENGTVFHGVSFNPADHSVRRFGREDLDRELADPAVFSWIDIQAPDIAVLNEVLRRWDIDLKLVSHFDAPEVLPRIVERSDCLAFYLHEIEEPGRHLDTSRGPSELRAERLILVLGADFVITYHRRPLDAAEAVKATCTDAFRLAGRTPGFIAFLFLQRGVHDFAHLNLANDNFLDRLNQDAKDPRRRAEEIGVAGRNILTLKKLTGSLHIVLMLLATKRNPFISDEARGSFHDMLSSAAELRAAVDSSRDLLDGILAGIQTAAADRTNQVVRALTVMSGILLPLTLITGIYGMNFEHMRGLRHELGYWLTLGGMAVLAVVLLFLFRRLGWVGRSRRDR